MGKRLYVGNLSYSTTREALEAAVRQRARLMSDEDDVEWIRLPGGFLGPAGHGGRGPTHVDHGRGAGIWVLNRGQPASMGRRSGAWENRYESTAGKGRARSPVSGINRPTDTVFQPSGDVPPPRNRRLPPVLPFTPPGER